MTPETGQSGLKVQYRLERIDSKIAKELAKLTEAVYGSTYYVPGYTDGGAGWISDFDEGGVIIIARGHEGEIVGVSCISSNPETNTALLYNTIVHPHFQGKGIGSGLNQKRIEFLKNLEKQQKLSFSVVENRAHQPGSFMSLLKEGNFTPIALTPDDALPYPDYYLREYYLLSVRTKMRLGVTTSSEELKSFLSPWQDIIVIKQESGLPGIYKDHPSFHKITPSKGAVKVIATPEGLTQIDFPSEVTSVVYMTSVEHKSHQHLTGLGFKINGLRPWIDLCSADKRPCHNETVDSFIVYSRIFPGDKITKPSSDLKLDGLNPSTGEKLRALFQNIT